MTPFAHYIRNPSVSDAQAMEAAERLLSGGASFLDVREALELMKVRKAK